MPFSPGFSPFSRCGVAALAFMDPVARFTVALVRALVVNIRARATADALRGLDDHILKDIGVPRSEIVFIAQQTAMGLRYRQSAARSR